MMSSAGNAAFASVQVLAVLAVIAPSLTTSAPMALKMSAGVSAKSAPFTSEAKTIPSIADADFHDLGHAVLGAQVNIRLLDARGGVRDVDGGFAQAFAHLLAARTRTAAFHDRGREVEVLAKRFGDDGGIGQNGRGAGDLQLVAGVGGSGGGGKRQDRYGEFHHGSFPLTGVQPPVRRPCRPL